MSNMYVNLKLLKKNVLHFHRIKNMKVEKKFVWKPIEYDGSPLQWPKIESYKSRKSCKTNTIHHFMSYTSLDFIVLIELTWFYSSYNCQQD